MTFAPKDRVKDTTTTTGTGTITLAGAPPTTFQGFSAVGNGNTCPYTIIDNSTGAWESGIGTYTSSGTTLSRDTVLASSNSGSLVNFAAGTKDVIISLPVGLVGYQQIGSTQTPSGVASSSITSIPDRYSDLLVEVLGLSHDSGSAQSLRIEISPDGSTWTSPVNISNGTVANAITLYGGVFIPGYRRGAGFLSTSVDSLTADITDSVSASVSRAWRVSAGISAIRLSPSGGNFDAGSWKLWGKL